MKCKCKWNVKAGLPAGSLSPFPSPEKQVCMTAAGTPNKANGPQRAIAAHKGTIGNPPRGPGGPGGFSDLGKILVKPLPGRVWGEMATPKGFLGTIQTNPLAKNLGKPCGGPIPPQNYVFQAPFLGPKRDPRPSWAKMWGRGYKNWFRGQNIKVANRKAMQNTPAVSYTHLTLPTICSV